METQKSSCQHSDNHGNTNITMEIQSLPWQHSHDQGNTVITMETQSQKCKQSSSWQQSHYHVNTVTAMDIQSFAWKHSHHQGNAITWKWKLYIMKPFIFYFLKTKNNNPFGYENTLASQNSGKRKLCQLLNRYTYTLGST